MIFGGSCGENEDVELQLEFKKLVMKCFGVQDGDILLLYDFKCTEIFFYDSKKHDPKTKKDKRNKEKIKGFKYVFFQKKKGRYVCCFIKGDIKPKTDEFKRVIESRCLPPTDLELEGSIYVRASDIDDDKYQNIYVLKG